MPDELISLARLLLQTKAEWEKTKAKGKVPKPAMDATIAAIAIDVLERRLKEYPTSIQVRALSLGSPCKSRVTQCYIVQEDEALLANPSELSFNHKMAVTVRLGEKRILAGTLKELQSQYGKDANKRKRGHADTSKASGKKARR